MNKKQKRGKTEKSARDSKRKQNLALEKRKLQRKCREVFGRKKEKLKKDGVGIITDGEIIDIVA